MSSVEQGEQLTTGINYWLWIQIASGKCICQTLILGNNTEVPGWKEGPVSAHTNPGITAEEVKIQSEWLWTSPGLEKADLHEHLYLDQIRRTSYIDLHYSEQ